MERKSTQATEQRQALRVQYTVSHLLASELADIGQGLRLAGCEIVESAEDADVVVSDSDDGDSITITVPGGASVSHPRLYAGYWRTEAQYARSVVLCARDLFKQAEALPRVHYRVDHAEWDDVAAVLDALDTAGVAPSRSGFVYGEPDATVTTHPDGVMVDRGDMCELVRPLESWGSVADYAAAIAGIVRGEDELADERDPERDELVDIDAVRSGSVDVADMPTVLELLCDEVEALRAEVADLHDDAPAEPIDESPEARQVAREAWPLHRSHIDLGVRMLRRSLESLERLTYRTVDVSGYRSGSPAVTARRIAADIAEDAGRLGARLVERVDEEMAEAARIETAGAEALEAISRAARRGDSR